MGKGKRHRARRAAEGSQSNDYPIEIGSPDELSGSRPIPAFCTNAACGLVFASRLFLLRPGSRVENISITNSHEPCPRCGSLARTAEGTFNIEEGVLEILAASDSIRERLDRLREALVRARDEEISDDALQQSLRQEAPGLHALYERTPRQLRAALIGFLIFMLQLAAQHEFDALTTDPATRPALQRDVGALKADLQKEEGLTRSVVQQAVRQALQEYQRQPPLSEQRQPR